ncbi:MAG: flavodoxin family protein [Thermoguttaceae bacterium]
MKIIGISGSPRKEGNTSIAVQTALSALNNEGFETEFFSLADLPVKSCVACYGCGGKKRCVLDDPNFDLLFEKFISADAIIVGSPVYFGSATPQIMSLLDRVGFVSRMNDNPLKRKIGASIAVARRAGANFTFSQLNYFFLINEMIIPGSTYWNIGYGLAKGDISNDAEGIETFENLAKNISWLLKKIQ